MRIYDISLLDAYFRNIKPLSKLYEHPVDIPYQDNSIFLFEKMKKYKAYLHIQNTTKYEHVCVRGGVLVLLTTLI